VVAPYLGPRKSIAEVFEPQEGYPESRAFNRSYWKVVRDYAGSVGPIPQRIRNLDFLSDFPERTITREDVRAMFQEVCDERAIFWTIVWGYPRARIGNNPDNIMNALVSAEAMANELNAIREESMRSPLGATSVIKRLNEAGNVGASTSSKVVAMARLYTQEGECVILDRQVIASIFWHRFKEFAELERKLMPRTVNRRSSLGERIETAFNRRNEVYGDYVNAVSVVAGNLGTTPEQIERFLFDGAPSQAEVKKINKRWEATKARRLKQKRHKKFSG
jgi:hypothetical protein